MTNRKKIIKLVKDRRYLFWDINNFDALSDEAIVERILNYGDWRDTQKLLKLMGAKNVALIFKKQTRKRITNYAPAIKNFFSLYLKNNA
ncbi:MAG: hypothetical protein ABIB72_01210 [Candidatus Falkowbacteria bacterium]